MATGSLPAIFPFKVLRTFLTFILTFVLALGFSGRLGFSSRVYAAAWYIVKGSGVLSGGEINNPSIPSDPSPYDPLTVQNPNGTTGSPMEGALISGGSQNVKAGGTGTQDAYIKNTGIDLSLDRLNVASVANTPGIVTLTNCSSPLNPGTIYRASASCVSGLSLGSYSLSSPGLAIIIVNDSANSINFTGPVSQTDPAKRILIVTNSTVSYASSVTDLDFSVISTNTSSYTVRGQTEGPIVVKMDVVLPNDLGVSPGSVVTFNPTYLVELSKKGVANLEIKGLLESKSTWRYE